MMNKRITNKTHALFEKHRAIKDLHPPENLYPENPHNSDESIIENI